MDTVDTPKSRARQSTRIERGLLECTTMASLRKGVQGRVQFSVRREDLCNGYTPVNYCIQSARGQGYVDNNFNQVTSPLILIEQFLAHGRANGQEPAGFRP